MLGFIGGTVATSILGLLHKEKTFAQSLDTSTQIPTPNASATNTSCVVKPQQTEGPYFVDEKLNRSDIRLDPSNNLMKQGVPLSLVFQVSRINGNSCIPLNSASVDIWHGKQLILQLTKVQQRYVGTFNIGLQIT